MRTLLARNGSCCPSRTRRGSSEAARARRAGLQPLPPPTSFTCITHRIPSSRCRHRGGCTFVRIAMFDLDTINGLFGDAVTVADGRVTVSRPAVLAGPPMDQLVRAAVFADGVEREYARWLIWELGQAVGVQPASIQDLYMARGRGEVHGFTVPAINLRVVTYEAARAIFRTAIAIDAGAFILEIARSEIAYTGQRPHEYVAVILAAALREGFRGPVFIQGDHFQINHKKYAVDPQPEVEAVKQLVREAVGAGFYNIDIDTSTLVDISKPTHTEQQVLNVREGVDLMKEVRSVQPPGVT